MDGLLMATIHILIHRIGYPIQTIDKGRDKGEGRREKGEKEQNISIKKVHNHDREMRD